MNLKPLLVLITLCIVANNSVSQTVATPIEKNAFSFALDMLQEGIYQADILDTPLPTSEQTAIVQRIQESLSSKPEWTKEVMQRLGPGEPFPYHENLGIEEDEYRSILSIWRSEKLVKIDSTSIRIMHDDGVIRFALTGDGNNSLLDYLSIDKENRQIYIDDAPLKFSTHLLMDKSKSKFSNAWHGYVWEYQDFPVERLEDLDLSAQFDATLFKCTIGKMEETSDIILYVTAKIIEQGKPIVNANLMLALRRMPI